MPTGPRDLYPPLLRYGPLAADWVERVSTLARIEMQRTLDQRISGAIFGGKNPDAIAWAFDHAADLLLQGQSDGLLQNPQQLPIRQTVVNAMRDDASLLALAETMRTVHGFSFEAAKVISWTEMHCAQGHGALAGAIAVGMKAKKWLASNDPGICPGCRANADQGWIAIDLPFASGAMASLDHVGCRCDVTYRRKF